MVVVGGSVVEVVEVVDVVDVVEVEVEVVVVLTAVVVVAGVRLLLHATGTNTSSPISAQRLTRLVWLTMPTAWRLMRRETSHPGYPLSSS